MTTRTLYADGGVIFRNPSSIGGTWAFVIVNDDGKIHKSMSGAFMPGALGLSEVTNNQTEMYALLRGLREIPQDCDHLVICTDSMVTIGRVHLGWKWTNIPQLLHVWYQEIIQSLPAWRHNFQYILLDGHPTASQLENGIGKRGNPVSEFNVLCDQLCREAGELLPTQSAQTYEKSSGVSL